MNTAWAVGAAASLLSWNTSALRLEVQRLENSTLFLVQNIICTTFCQQTAPVQEHRVPWHSCHYVHTTGRFRREEERGYMWVKLAHGQVPAPVRPFPFCSPSPAYYVTDLTQSTEIPFPLAFLFFFCTHPFSLNSSARCGHGYLADILATLSVCFAFNTR